MSDAIRITPEVPPIISIPDIITELTRTGPTAIQENTPMFFLTSVGSIYKSLQEVGGPAQVLFVFAEEHPEDPSISLIHGAQILPIKPVVQFLHGPMVIINANVTGFYYISCDLMGMYFIKDILLSAEHPIQQMYSGNPQGLVEPPTHVRSISAIREDIPIAWLCDDRSLWHLLENRSIPLSQKIMGVIASNFPYVVQRNLPGIRYIRYSPPDAELAQTQVLNSEQALMRLGVFLLGPSYSRMDKMGQQIQRRLTSAFAGTNTLELLCSLLIMLVVCFICWTTIN